MGSSMLRPAVFAFLFFLTSLAYGESPEPNRPPSVNKVKSAAKKNAKQVPAEAKKVASKPPTESEIAEQLLFTPRPQKSFLDDPLVKKIHKRQARRRNALNALKMKGIVGEAETGLIMIRSSKSLNKKAKEKMEKLVKIENKDREIVIKKIGQLNNYTPEDEKLLRLKLFEGYTQFDGDQTYFFKNNRWQQR